MSLGAQARYRSSVNSVGFLLFSSFSDKEGHLIKERKKERKKHLF
jgi:hypothetical protein